MPEISLVAPCFNEEEVLDIFFERVEAVLEQITPDYEVVCVDDGSSDRTYAGLLKHRERNPRIKVLRLSRNFGKDVALSAGLDHTTGRAVVPIDVDLQDPPEVIAQMYAKFQEGYDVVFARRASRDTDGMLKRVSARAFYQVHNAVADVAIPYDTGDFRMLDRRVIQALKRLPERTRFMKGLFAWVGFEQTSIEYAREARAAGTTKWAWWKLWNFALDGITASSTIPLRIWSYLGMTVASLSFLYASFLIARTLISGIDVPGYASTMVVVLFLGGINIAATGILGEYIGRIYVEVRSRPLYLVRDHHGLSPSDRP